MKDKLRKLNLIANKVDVSRMYSIRVDMTGIIFQGREYANRDWHAYLLRNKKWRNETYVDTDGEVFFKFVRNDVVVILT